MFTGESKSRRVAARGKPVAVDREVLLSLAAADRGERHIHKLKTTTATKVQAAFRSHQARDRWSRGQLAAVDSKLSDLTKLDTLLAAARRPAFVPPLPALLQILRTVALAPADNQEGELRRLSSALQLLLRVVTGTGGDSFSELTYSAPTRGTFTVLVSRLLTRTLQVHRAVTAGNASTGTWLLSPATTPAHRQCDATLSLALTLLARLGSACAPAPAAPTSSSTLPVITSTPISGSSASGGVADALSRDMSRAYSSAVVHAVASVLAHPAVVDSLTDVTYRHLALIPSASTHTATHSQATVTATMSTTHTPVTSASASAAATSTTDTLLPVAVSLFTVATQAALACVATGPGVSDAPEERDVAAWHRVATAFACTLMATPRVFELPQVATLTNLLIPSSGGSSQQAAIGLLADIYVAVGRWGGSGAREGERYRVSTAPHPILLAYALGNVTASSHAVRQAFGLVTPLQSGYVAAISALLPNVPLALFALPSTLPHASHASGSKASHAASSRLAASDALSNEYSWRHVDSVSVSARRDGSGGIDTRQDIDIEEEEDAEAPDRAERNVDLALQLKRKRQLAAMMDAPMTTASSTATATATATASAGGGASAGAGLTHGSSIRAAEPPSAKRQRSAVLPDATGSRASSVRHHAINPVVAAQSRAAFLAHHQLLLLTHVGLRSQLAPLFSAPALRALVDATLTSAVSPDASGGLPDPAHAIQLLVMVNELHNALRIRKAAASATATSIASVLPTPTAAAGSDSGATVSPAGTDASGIDWEAAGTTHADNVLIAMCRPQYLAAMWALLSRPAASTASGGGGGKFVPFRPLASVDPSSLLLSQPSATGAFTLFLRALARALITTDDIEFSERGLPLPLPHITDILRVVKYQLHKLCWLDGDTQLTRRPTATLECMSAGIAVFNQLFDRYSRKPFCAPGEWLWPAIPDSELNAEVMLGLSEDAVDDDAMAAPTLTTTAAVEHHDGEGSGVSFMTATAGVWTRKAIRAARMQLILTTMPQVIPFVSRVRLFQALLAYAQSESGAGEMHMGMIRGAHRFTVRRSQLVEDSFKAFREIHGNAAALKAPFKITFINKEGLEEAGIDGGGLLKEFIDSVVREAFSPAFVLFRETPEHALYPNPASSFATPRHLDYFEFLGELLGKAVYEGILVEPRFAGFFLRKLLGRANMMDDLSSLDAVVYRSLMSLKQYSGDFSDLGLAFEVTDEVMGATTVVPLVPGGASIPVDKHNVTEYILRVSNYRLNHQIAAQCRAFLRGFRQLVPLPWIRMFGPHELQTLIGGDEAPINMRDLRAHTAYHGFEDGDEYIETFWRVVGAFSEEDKRAFLMFTTSCSRPPLLGFGALHPRFGVSRVPITADNERLPTAATCMALLKLPCPYSTEAVLRDKLLFSIHSGSGFELS